MTRRRHKHDGSIWSEPRNGKKYWHAKMPVIGRNGLVHHYVYASSYNKTTARTRAERKAQRAQAQLNAGPAATMTLRERGATWIDGKRNEVTPETLFEYQRQLERYVYPELGDTLLHDLTTADIRTLLDRLHNSGRHSTADHVHTTLKQLLSHSVRDGYLEQSPMRELKKRSNKRHAMGTGPQATEPIRLLSPHTIAALLHHTTGSIHDIITIFLFTGVRSGELITLQWDDLTPNDTHLHIKRSHKPRSPHRTGPPKSIHAVRKIPLGPEAQHAIQRQRERQHHDPPQHNQGWIFPNQTGGIHDPRHLYHRWKRALRHAKTQHAITHPHDPPIPHYRLHDLRHTYASFLARKGHTIKEIQHLLGHADPNLAQRIYTHIHHDDITNATLTLNDILTPKP